MYVRYKKNIQENDLPRKRVRKASKIAGSGGQLFGNKIPREGTETKYHMMHDFSAVKIFGNKIPREGTETDKTKSAFVLQTGYNLEIRYPERGRKLYKLFIYHIISSLFGNKIPREGTETFNYSSYNHVFHYLEIRYPERGRKHNFHM